MRLARMWLVATDELSVTLRRPMIWILLALVALLTFLMANGNAQIVIASGDATVGGKKAFLTSEFALSQIIAATVFLFYIFFVAAAAGMVVIRDAEAKVLELFLATPLGPREYGWARLLGSLGAFVVVLAMHLAVTMLIFHAIPNPEMADMRGPFAVGNYVRPALLFGIPAILFVGGTAFAIGTTTRRAILVFVLPVVLLVVCTFFLWDWTPSWLDERWNRVLMFIDPGGIRWLRETWLEVDRGAEFYNTQRVRLDTLFLANRVLMLVIGAGVAAFGIERFAGRARSTARLRQDEVARALGAISPVEASVPRTAVTTVPRMVPDPSYWSSLLAVTRAEARELGASPGLYLFVPIILIQTLVNSLFAIGAFDTPLLITPGQIAVSVQTFLATLLSLLLVLYGVESLDRERSTGLSAIHRALPVRTGAIVGGKMLALGVLWGVVVAACFVAAVIAMLIQGRVSIRLAPFVLIWGVVLLPTLLVWTSFLFAVFAVSGSRYTTYGVTVLTFGVTVYLAITGDLTWMFNWPLWGAVPWSDLSVLEFDRRALVLNRLLMLALAVAFARLATSQYPRRDRDAIHLLHAFAPRRLVGAFRQASPWLVAPLLLAILLWREIAAGPEGPRAEKLAKEYWRRNFATWSDAPVPWLARADLDVEVMPDERAWSVRGSYLVINQIDSTISKLPVTVGSWDDVRWTLDGQEAKPDTVSRLYVFDLPHALRSGDSVRLGFTYRGQERGSTKRGGGAGEFVLPSGVVMTSFSPRYFPVLGFVDGIGVDEDNRFEARRFPDDFWLDETPPLFGSQRLMTTRLTVTVPQGFTANGVGERVRDEVTDGRRVIEWRSDQPVMAFNIVAARLTERRGDGTALYHHPDHDYNVAEMVDAMNAARRWFGEWFGAYPWKELKITEFPALRSYAQGFPTNISFSESIGFLTKSEPKTNLAFLVTAHESAHQWWGNMLQPGLGPSGNLLSEGMAHFSTALLIEQVKGERNAIEFRKRIETRYAEQRRSDAERPLTKVDGSRDGDNTLLYDKGGWVFLMLSDLMGRQRTLDGMKAFVTRFHGQDDHPVLHDFIAHLRGVAPDTAAYDAFARQWFDSVVVPEFRVTNVTRGSGDDSAPNGNAGQWTTTATVENVGSGRVAVTVAVVRGERFPSDTSAAPKVPYARSDTILVLDAKRPVTVKIGSTFEPERVVVDPDVKVLQLRRRSAEASVPGATKSTPGVR